MKASNKHKKHVGRPSAYTPELAEEICEAISSDSKGLRRLCKEHKHWPDRTNIYRWFKKYPEFRHQYAQAKKHQIESLVDEILEIADDTSHDTIIKRDGEGNKRVVCNSEWINRSRLRIDTRKWLASKLAPKLYGDKITNEHSELNRAPIEYANLTPKERMDRVAEILTTARIRRDSEACGSTKENQEAKY